MSKLSPKPVITRVVRTWQVPPGMTFALVEDVEQHIWIVQSCPVGTHAWSVDQAAMLPHGPQTRSALEEAVDLGRQLQQQRREAAQAALEVSPLSEYHAEGKSLLCSQVRESGAARPLRHGRSVEREPVTA